MPPPRPPDFDPPSRPLTFHHRAGVWDVTGRARVVGILNLTPDSFFDGGHYSTPDAALARAEAMAAEGADAIDIGGQSTRPGAMPLGAEEEWARVALSLPSLAKRINVPLSIDTYDAEVARRALDAGVAMVNDVSGLGVDPALADVTARAGAGLILMHSVGAPGALHLPREYSGSGVASDVRAFLAERMALAESRGVPRERIALDPGIGFSKRAEQSMEALRGIPGLGALGRPVYVGVSRKSFLAARTGAPVEERLAAGLAATVAAYALGARIFRTHDVRETVEALRMAERLLLPAPVALELGAGA